MKPNSSLLHIISWKSDSNPITANSKEMILLSCWKEIQIFLDIDELLAEVDAEISDGIEFGQILSFVIYWKLIQKPWHGEDLKEYVLRATFSKLVLSQST